MPAKFKFLGGVRTVTGSSHLVSTDKSRLLIDAGLFQGHRDEFYRINTAFSFNPRKIDAFVLSHAHIDHAGNIPSLVKQGMRCKIFATSATRDLCRIMLADSGKIQEEDVRYVNKINKRLGLPPRRPLYTKADAAKSVKRFRPVSYKRTISVTRDISAAFYDAGHILGSSIIILDIKEGQKNIRLGYAVDLGRKNLPLLNDPYQPQGLDYLILESTYGGRLHRPIEEAKAKLKDAINRTIERQGKVIIPSFILERTQEILFFLNELLKEKAIPSIPIYVDSPMAIDITEIFKYHLDFLDEETRQNIRSGNSPFDFLNLKYIRGREESKRLNEDKRPMIIIAGSGMCEAGRILHHLKNNIEDTRNTILLVGYMAANTLGKKIVDKARRVRIFGVEYELNAEVVVINAFSAHADKEDLVNFVLGCLPLKKVFLVHGDEDQAQILADALLEKGIRAHIPYKDEEVLLN